MYIPNPSKVKKSVKHLIVRGLIWIFYLLSIKNSFAQTGNFPYFNPLSQPSNSIQLLTGRGNAPIFTNNALQLTDNAKYQSGAMILNGLNFPSSYGIHIEFEFASFGGTGNADGLAMILLDADNLPTSINGSGSTLGYTYSKAGNTIDDATGFSGIKGGYLAIGLDEWGNFKQTMNGITDHRNGLNGGGEIFGTYSSSKFKNNITIRGTEGKNFRNYNEDKLFNIPDNWWGYPVLYTCRTDNSTNGASAATLNTSDGTYSINYSPVVQNSFILSSNYTTPNNIDWDPTNPDYRKAMIDIFPVNNGFNISVKIQHGSIVEPILTNYFYPANGTIKYLENSVLAQQSILNLNTAPPKNFSLGFSASTGGSSNYHFIHNLSVTLPASAIAHSDTVYTSPSNAISNGITFPILENDSAYRNVTDLTTTLLPENVSPASFSFNEDAFHIMHGQLTTFYNAKDTGTWQYNGDGTVTFTAEPQFKGIAQILYSIKSLYNPFDAEAYRSNGAMLVVALTPPAIAHPDTTSITISPNNISPIATLNVLKNDSAYGLDFFKGYFTPSPANVDPQSFIFYNTAGTPVPGNTYHQNGVGVWSYETGVVHFTPEFNFTGVATIAYSINGYNVIYHGNTYFGTNEYRSVPTQCYVNVQYEDLYFPSGFTPNYDNVNDVFQPIGNLSILKDFKLYIYDRWGKCIFMSLHPEQGWDGNLQGRIPAPIGTYIWVSSYKKNNTTYQRKGTVTLIR